MIHSFQGLPCSSSSSCLSVFSLNGPVSALFCWLHTHLWEANPPSFSKFWKYRFSVKHFVFFSLFPLTSGKVILVTHSCLQISQRLDSYACPLLLRDCMANHKILTNQKKIIIFWHLILNHICLFIFYISLSLFAALWATYSNPSSGL